ncbi:MAG: hypothetical protein HRF51_08145 [bacterium]|jgi:hypothetical protein
MKKFWANAAIPAALFLVFAGIYLSISIYNKNYNLFLPVWDIDHYLTISEFGYQVYPCTPGVEYPAGKICGNAGWYPFWPLVVKTFRPLLGGSSQLAFIGLAFLFTFLSFQLLYRWAQAAYDRLTAIMAVAALAFGPSGFYLLSGFPYALFILLFILYLYLYYDENIRFRMAALFLIALGISLTYPTGLLLLLIPLIGNLRNRPRKNRRMQSASFWLRQILYAFPFILGPLLLWSYFYFKFDDFFLQLHFQEKYQRTWDFPLTVIFRSFTHYPWHSPENLTLLWYGLAFLFFFPYRVGIELVSFSLVMFLFSPATGTTMSLYRHYLIIFPLYLMIAASPRPTWFKMLYILLGLAISLLKLFPLFLNLRLI